MNVLTFQEPSVKNITPYAPTGYLHKEHVRKWSQFCVREGGLLLLYEKEKGL